MLVDLPKILFTDIIVRTYNARRRVGLGTDVMIFKIFSPKKIAKKLAFLTRNKAKLCKQNNHNNGF
jgi:hypothetical protein